MYKTAKVYSLLTGALPLGVEPSFRAVCFGSISNDLDLMHDRRVY